MQNLPWLPSTASFLLGERNKKRKRLFEYWKFCSRYNKNALVWYLTLLLTTVYYIPSQILTMKKSVRCGRLRWSSTWRRIRIDSLPSNQTRLPITHTSNALLEVWSSYSEVGIEIHLRNRICWIELRRHSFAWRNYGRLETPLSNQTIVFSTWSSMHMPKAEIDQHRKRHLKFLKEWSSRNLTNLI